MKATIGDARKQLRLWRDQEPQVPALEQYRKLMARFDPADQLTLSNELTALGEWPAATTLERFQTLLTEWTEAVGEFEKRAQVELHMTDRAKVTAAFKLIPRDIAVRHFDLQKCRDLPSFTVDANLMAAQYISFAKSGKGDKIRYTTDDEPYDEVDEIPEDAMVRFTDRRTGKEFRLRPGSLSLGNGVKPRHPAPAGGRGSGQGGKPFTGDCAVCGKPRHKASECRSSRHQDGHVITDEERKAAVERMAGKGRGKGNRIRAVDGANDEEPAHIGQVRDAGDEAVWTMASCGGAHDEGHVRLFGQGDFEEGSPPTTAPLEQPQVVQGRTPGTKLGTLGVGSRAKFRSVPDASEDARFRPRTSSSISALSPPTTAKRTTGQTTST